jgi:urocanate hydratase
LAFDSNQPAAIDFILPVQRHYAGLMLAASNGSDPTSEPGLGGTLLYAGELDRQGRALLVAGNIAGAASLAATADAVVQKQAVRDGVADFLVTTLDESVRILKNQIRKREAVSVCAAMAPACAEREMLDRGVLPDLLRPGYASWQGEVAFRSQGSRQVEQASPGERLTLVTWQVAAAPALWLPKLDALALGCLSPTAWSARRWLRFAPRYLGRLAQGVRVLYCEPDSAREFASLVQALVHSGEIGVPVRVSLDNMARLND